MSYKTRIDLCVMRGESRDFEITVTGSSEARVDLTGATVYFRVKKQTTDAIVEIEKDSGTISEIEILDQGVDETKGKAKIYLVPSDTELLEPGNHRYGIWVDLAAGDRIALVPDSLFYIDRGVVELFVATPPSFPGSPASQNPDQQTFTFTVTSAGTAQTVTLPAAMYDATYVVTGNLNTPAAAETSYITSVPDASKTTTQFVANFSSSLSVGTTVSFNVRDEA